jgi:hypothetical protein
MVHRIGTFFLTVGALLVGLFILSDVADAPSCGFLWIGLAAILLGGILWFRDPGPPPQPSDRFRVLKSMQKKQDQKNRRS